MRVAWPFSRAVVGADGRDCYAGSSLVVGRVDARPRAESEGVRDGSGAAAWFLWFMACIGRAGAVGITVGASSVPLGPASVLRVTG